MSEEQKIYFYPKTSCPCENCESKNKPIGFRSNLGIPGCENPATIGMDCHNRLMLGQQIQPFHQKGWTELNRQVLTNKLDPSFGKLPKGCNSPAGCEAPSYVSADPRLFSSTRADYTVLDRPPINGNVPLNDIYNPKWNHYSRTFEPYETIGDGQIEYYVDTSIQNAYFDPNFTTKAHEVGVLYRDPMGSIKPEYSRLPIFNTENPVTRCKGEYMYCLSWMDDSTAQREDILSYQMRKRNQERWETRWSQKLNS